MQRSRVQRLSSAAPTGDRIVMFVPRWLPISERQPGLPYRIVPVLSVLLRNGVDVDLTIEPHDGPFPDACRRLLDGALAAVAWCAELNPGEQLPGLHTFLDRVLRAAPGLPRLIGGGFVPLAPRDFEFGSVAAVRSEEVGALLQHLFALRGRDVSARQPFGVDALYAMDLAPFAHSASMFFDDDAPSLQLPTGLGCGKACPFCFYENTRMRVLPAAGVADAMLHCRDRYGVRRFQLGELDFLAGTRRALDLAALLRSRGAGVRWFALGSVQDILRLGDDGMQALAAAGLSALETGTEAGTDDALRMLGKKFSVAEAEAAHATLVRAGIKPVHNFLLGWPGERAVDRRGTLALVDRFHRLERRTVFHFRAYQAIPTTTFAARIEDSHEAVPRSWQALERWREHQRRLPWLTAHDEAEVRFLTEYLLPLGYGDELAGATASVSRKLLRAFARWRARQGHFAFAIDRMLFGATRGPGLRTTWLA